MSPFEYFVIALVALACLASVGLAAFVVFGHRRKDKE